jgi:hypothetical protein
MITRLAGAAMAVASAWWLARALRALRIEHRTRRAQR